MLLSRMKEEECLTVGDEVVIQAFPDSSAAARLVIKAPQELTILRGEVRERSAPKDWRAMAAKPW